jgi:[histone H3]-lysine4 N-trimethyltransferase SETD1
MGVKRKFSGIGSNKEVKKAKASPNVEHKRNSSPDAQPELIETKAIEPQLGNRPYLFVSAGQVVVQGDRIQHLKSKLRPSHPESVRADKSGYFVFFENSVRGDNNLSSCAMRNGAGFWFFDRIVKLQVVGRGV